jgi:hypothetical protein
LVVIKELDHGPGYDLQDLVGINLRCKMLCLSYGGEGPLADHGIQGFSGPEQGLFQAMTSEV